MERTDFLTVVGAALLDGLFGEPPHRLHPVVWIGAMIERGPRQRKGQHGIGTRVHGALESLAVVATVATIAGRADRVVGLANHADAPGRIAQPILRAVLLKPAFAARSLLTAANRVTDPLRHDNLCGARDGLSWLCSRDAAALDASKLVAATIESLAENTSDSVVAPLFWFGVGGLRGAWAYRAINTLDAMIGYRGPWEDVGAFAARLDDAANLAPARLTAVAIALCAPLGGGSPRDAWRVARRDAAETESPNAGWPMAAMAGALGVTLEKRGHYCLLPEGRSPVLDDVARAQRIAAGAMLLSALTVAGACALRGSDVCRSEVRGSSGRASAGRGGRR